MLQFWQRESYLTLILRYFWRGTKDTRNPRWWWRWSKDVFSLLMMMMMMCVSVCHDKSPLPTSELSTGGANWAARYSVGQLWPSDDDDDDGADQKMYFPPWSTATPFCGLTDSPGGTHTWSNCQPWRHHRRKFGNVLTLQRSISLCSLFLSCC